MEHESRVHDHGCPLCSSEASFPFAAAHGRSFLRCADCHLTFVPESGHLSHADELARYRLHENDPGDPRYRRFLGRLVDPLAAVLPPGAEGLDFGCGPGPTLSVMMEERGFRTADYDPYFRPDRTALERRYDFITCSEVLEHLAHPGEELERLVRLLRPGGWLGVMTELLVHDEAFPDWWYARDPTHVAFFGEETLGWIAGRHDLEMRRASANVTLYRRKPS